jgi:hypothetical protein
MSELERVAEVPMLDVMASKSSIQPGQPYFEKFAFLLNTSIISYLRQKTLGKLSFYH